MAYFPNSKGFIILGLILIILLIPIIQVVRPCPVIEAKPISPEIELPGNFSVTFPAQGESAVGTDNLGVIASTDDQTPVPIASVAKIMTAYLVLQTYPLKAGQTGPSLIMNAQDVSDYQFSVENGHSVLKVEEGESLTEKQLLQGLMLPSANNIANTLARWVSGSEEAFVDKMNETAESLGMKDTHYADASGVSPETVSNAVDQIKIARVAMEDPIFREIVAMPQVTLPVAGTVYNVNYMLGKHGIVGIKTGSTLDAGGCFVSAAPIVAGKEKHYIIAAVLGQKTEQSLKSALDTNAEILNQVRTQLQLYPLTQPSTGFSQITTAWHTNSDLTTTQPVQIFGYPGMKLSLSIDLLKTQLPISVGENVAVLKIQSGQELLEVPLQNTKQINRPGLLWRLLRN
ncbi:MAG: D-alanyl-D-alanine carboxypeptidase [Desulfitobacteriaceae bacterium]|nr:D-alanyl-D-alanine carboxypeptidase [Desulfitobacteriaceae bacterium]MDD4345796.1 D-alanyl-D-alanine carboxypeptidase [Desulfitobacteriaceae bacterium]